MLVVSLLDIYCCMFFSVYLTHLDYQDTGTIMTEKLRNQVNGAEWSWKNLNTVTLIILMLASAYSKAAVSRHWHLALFRVVYCSAVYRNLYSFVD